MEPAQNKRKKARKKPVKIAELTKSARKLFASLSGAKTRYENGLFMAQGTKCVLDTIDYFEIIALLCTIDWHDHHRELCRLHQAIVCKQEDIDRITTLSTAPEVIAVYRIPDEVPLEVRGRLTIALDGVQDPGNLGTILRVADWMGVTDIIASEDTVDVWSPKVIQATMGAVSRVRVHYTDLVKTLTQYVGVPVYGTFLNGENIYQSHLTDEGIIVMGNEGQGIRAATEAVVTHRLYIPPYPAGRHTSESLNVAIATAITLSEFRRRPTVIGRG